MVKSFIELSYANQNLTSRADSVIRIGKLYIIKQKIGLRED